MSPFKGIYLCGRFCFLCYMTVFMLIFSEFDDEQLFFYHIICLFYYSMSGFQCTRWNSLSNSLLYEPVVSSEDTFVQDFFPVAVMHYYLTLTYIAEEEEIMKEEPRYNIEEEVSAIKSTILTKWKELEVSEKICLEGRNQFTRKI